MPYHPVFLEEIGMKSFSKIIQKESIMSLKSVFKKVTQFFDLHEKNMSQFQRGLNTLDRKIQARVYALMFLQR